MRSGHRGLRRTGSRLRHRRRAAAALELALILPVLCLIASITIDYSRLFYHWTIITSCAYNGASYASLNPTATASAVSGAALTDATNLTSPAPTVSVAPQGTDSGGNAYIEVTVSYTFQSIFPWPGMPTSVALSRKLRMSVTPP